MSHLNEIIDAKGITKHQLADISGVSYTSITLIVKKDNYEYCTKETQKKIAKALGFTVNEIINGGEGMKRKLLETEVRKATEHLARLLRIYSADPMYLNLTVFTRDAEAKTLEDNCEGLPDYYGIRCHEASDVEGIVPTISESARVYYTDSDGIEKIGKVFKYEKE